MTGAARISAARPFGFFSIKSAAEDSHVKPQQIRAARASGRQSLRAFRCLGLPSMPSCWSANARPQLKSRTIPRNIRNWIQSNPMRMRLASATLGQTLTGRLECAPRQQVACTSSSRPPTLWASPEGTRRVKIDNARRPVPCTKCVRTAGPRPGVGPGSFYRAYRRQSF